MKSFFYFLLGASVTLNVTMAVDYAKKSYAYSKKLKTIEEKVDRLEKKEVNGNV